MILFLPQLHPSPSSHCYPVPSGRFTYVQFIFFVINLLLLIFIPIPPQGVSSPLLQGLTSSLLLHASLTFLLSPPGLLHLLVLTTLVEVLHHDANEHVEDEEADNQEEGDEIEQHPGVVVGHGLEESRSPKTQRNGDPITFRFC